MIVFENKFSAIICQTQQSSIATATLRSPLGFCRRSSPVLGGKFVCFFVFSFQFSAFRFPLSVFSFPFSVLRFPFSVFRFPFSEGYHGADELRVIKGY